MVRDRGLVDEQMSRLKALEGAYEDGSGRSERKQVGHNWDIQGVPEADEYIRIGTLNGLFVLGRSIGFIGHHLDQKRLRAPLYRHPRMTFSSL